MYFSIPAAVALFAVVGSALPVSGPYSVLSRRDLKLKSYNEMSISNFTAGKAGERAKQIWTAGVDTANLAKVSDADAKILQTERENAEDAEAVFNKAIAKASGADKKALQVGKIQNKVLKLFGEVQNLEIKIAKTKAKGQSTTQLEAQLAIAQKKLNKNTNTDKTVNNGKASEAIQFVGQKSVDDERQN